jgi:hypothetical protein
MILESRVGGQQAEENADEIRGVEKRIIVLGVELLESLSLIIDKIHQVIRESSLPGIDIEQVSEAGPGDRIGYIDVPAAVLDSIVQRITAGVHAHQSKTGGTPRSPIEEDEQRGVRAVLVSSMEAIPDPGLG